MNEKMTANKMQLVQQEAQAADEAEHQLSMSKAFRLYYKAVIWSATLSLALVMESYVLQVMAAFNAQPAFQKTFGVRLPDGKYQIEAKWQSALANASKVGIILGLFTNGILIDRFGCKKVMLTALCLFICFNFVIFFAERVEVLFAGQLLVGLPLGVFNTVGSIYATEVCPMALRGVMTTFVNLCWVIGHLIGAGVLQAMGTRTDQWGFRIPFALQWMWPVPLLVVCFFAPESPWWLVRKRRYEAAEAALNRLSVHDPRVKNYQTVALMRRTVEIEHGARIGASYPQCFNRHNGSLRRLEICALGYSTHTWGGFILQNYVTYFFTSAGLETTDSYKLSLGCYGIAFVTTSICFYMQDRMGRRLPFLCGYTFMTACMWIIGGLGFASGSGVQWGQAGLLLAWFGVYGLTVGPLPYIFAAEMPAVKLRSKTLNLSRIFYYLCDVINGVVAPYAINPTEWNLQGKAALITSSVSTMLIIWAFFRLPETNGRTYEELDLLFEAGVPARQFKDHDTAELRMRAVEKTAA
ncbi:general substrate transporter [Xylariomycetidae sp. FL0641]|nr:general substrate transporter [Xylariomycetidae sp. FL0641]